MNQTITLPRAVVEHVMYHLNRGDADAVCWADGVIKPALQQPQRKLTSQEIADSALLGNIESPFNGCMHQEYCKRWKAKAGADSSLRAAVQQACDWISEEPGRRPISAGRLLAILTNALAAAPQPPVVEMTTDEWIDRNVSGNPDLIKAMKIIARPESVEHDRPQLPVVEQPNGGAREAFEAWCHLVGLMQQSHGIVSISSHTDTAWLAWQAAIANCQQPQGEQKPVAGVVIDGSWNLPSLVRIGSEDSHIKKFGGNRLYTNPQPKREPQFDAISVDQERLAEQFCAEIAGPRGGKPSLPDPVRLLEMAEALYRAEAHQNGAIERAHRIGGEA